jgi:hypothetical protein
MGFHIGNASRLSLPKTEGGRQAFQCNILPENTWVYITVERHGDTLAYNCFRDEEVCYIDCL